MSIRTYVHQVSCRAHTYQDNDMCSCEPVELIPQALRSVNTCGLVCQYVSTSHGLYCPNCGHHLRPDPAAN